MVWSMTTPIQKVLYTAHATATNGRTGRIQTQDSKLDVPLAMPKTLGGPGGEGTNPEELFAAGYAACFGSAVGFVARSQNIKTGQVTIAANVQIGQVEKGFGLAVELVATIPDVTREQGEALLAAAHEVCPYSNATRGNIEVTVRLS